MRVHMLKSEPVKLDQINTKTYPAGWKGEVDDSLARAWIDKGSAEPAGSDAVARPELTDEETAVLKAAAQQALAASGGETVDPKTGEITGDGEPQAPAEVLASMTMPELRELAKVHSVKTFGVKRAEIEEEILKKLTA